jgi:hypothetical protein
MLGLLGGNAIITAVLGAALLAFGLLAQRPALAIIGGFVAVICGLQALSEGRPGRRPGRRPRRR